jgi:hypothetical protein
VIAKLGVDWSCLLIKSQDWQCWGCLFVRKCEMPELPVEKCSGEQLYPQKPVKGVPWPHGMMLVDQVGLGTKLTSLLQMLLDDQHHPAIVS